MIGGHLDFCGGVDEAPDDVHYNELGLGHGERASEQEVADDRHRELPTKKKREKTHAAKREEVIYQDRK